MNLRPSFSYQRRFRAALWALETPSLTSAAVLGSAAWIGTAIPAAAILSPSGGAGRSDATMSLNSALLGIDDRASAFGLTKRLAVPSKENGLPTVAQLE